MRDLTNEIVLRPRFVVQIDQQLTSVLQLFDQSVKHPFLIKRLDEHIYIRFQPEKSTFWTPQLHLELSSFEEGKTSIRGLFGPNPTLWTLFMFLHFGIATLFVILGVFAYSKSALGHDIILLVIGMLFLIVLWFGLYAFGRYGKKQGKPQMEELKLFMQDFLAQLQ